MRRFRDLPLRRKLVWILMGSTATALGVATAALGVYEFYSMRSGMVEETAALADVVGSNVTAALVFHEAGTARDALTSLHAQTRVLAGSVRDAEGTALARYRRPGVALVLPATLPPAGTYRFAGEYLDVVRPIVLDAERIGSVWIRVDTAAIYQGVFRLAAVSVVVMLGAALAALVVTSRLQALVSDPITRLARASGEIGRGHLGIHVPVESQDEIGELAQAFNDMALRLSETTVSKDYVDNVIRSIADSLIVAGVDGRIRTLNQATLGLLDQQEAELLGQRLDRILLAEAPDEVDVVGQLLEAGRLVNAERCYRRRDGQAVPVSLSSSVMRAPDGTVEGVVCVAQDLTQRKAAEHALLRATESAIEAARTKAQFLANMSHEIRTPMNGVIGMAELLLGTELDAEQRECAQVIRTSGQGLVGIINDILDFSKIEAGKLALESLPFSLSETVRGALATVALRATGKELDLVCDVAPHVPDDLVGDPVRIRQVLINLVGNAVKFTERGGIVVRVRLAGRDESTATVRFEVEDTGIGIPVDKQSTIFEAFTQADGSTSRRYGGTGLGLAISSNLVDLMGGKLSFTSEVGRGSTFTFGLPLAVAVARAEEGANAAQAFAEAESPPPALGTRILLVEDNPVNRKVAFHLLERRGFLVTVAANGIEALEALRARAFDAVLMDVQMPGMDGLAATAAIRAAERQRGGHLPIVGLTAHALAEDRERCLAAGMDDYLSKPFAPADLYAILERAIAGVRTSGNAAAPALCPARPAASVQTPVAPAIDIEIGLHHAGGDDELFRQLVELFLSEYPEMLAGIEDAARRNDAGMLARKAHKLKGSLAALGAAPAAALAARLSTLDSWPGDEACTAVAHLRGELHRLHQALEDRPAHEVTS